MIWFTAIERAARALALLLTGQDPGAAGSTATAPRPVPGRQVKPPLDESRAQHLLEQQAILRAERKMVAKRD